MNDQAKMTVGTSSKKADERLYFACPHVVEGNAVSIYLLNANRRKGERNQVLCAPCYWGSDPVEPIGDDGLVMVGPSGEPEVQEFSEEQAIRRGWIPKSRAMQYLLSITNDTTAGMAMDSRRKVLARRLHHSGLNDAETDFLWEVFNREDGDGVTPLSEEDEMIAELLVDKMFRK
jgi:hypothetical protein